ncbi:phage tail domain-containing protein [Staphylococcus saprophyticus]|uniref:phage tail domain-containing protein n=1 Tax=Staphylococcus saprophyticus TaxID=29385 RepID=UPI002DBE4E78|nr:phage tail domain-containing protein [Staphylococcus saprophyticus]MEB8335807.1 phage tail family protein [Staphylococcus saprophyticus]
MNKLQFPVGVKPLDFFVSSMEKERKEQSIDGIPGVVDYGFNYKQREASLTFFLRHYHGEHDYFLLESDLNAFLDSHEYFYVARNALPSRVIKVTVDGSFKPERILGSMYAQLEVDARITGLPFWQTKYTTQEIENSGYSGLVEKFGTADGINADNTKYTFTETTFKVWNGGNVTVDPRNMMLNIKMFYVKGTGSITNKTTGEKLNIINDWKGNHLTIEGVKIIKATNVNALRDTNRKFISLVPGNNEIEIKGLEFTKISFDFPYYYK